MSMRTCSCAGVLAFCLLVIAARPASAIGSSFLGLPKLGGYDAQTAGISADGSTLVGTCGHEAFRWSLGTGIVGLGHLPGDPESGAAASSGAGSMIVGSSGAFPTYFEPFLWTADSGMRSLGFPGYADDITPDGVAVVGTSNWTAYRWTEAGGKVELGRPAGATDSLAHAVSADGSVIAGNSGMPGGAESAWRWTRSGGFEDLGLLPNATQAYVMDMSQDGATVVGHSNGDGWVSEPFRWTAAEGMVGFGFEGFAKAVSGDGSIIAGFYLNLGHNGAFIWDQGHGARLAKTVLEQDYGLNLSGWELSQVSAMSLDGMVYAGRGYNPAGVQAAWVAIVPEPATVSLLVLAALVASRRRLYS
jgi:uncharacterized membrane protein